MHHTKLRAPLAKYVKNIHIKCGQLMACIPVSNATLSKMMSKLLLIVATIALVSAEAPAKGPYAAAGWRPQVPFNLPSEYRPSAESTFEISRERIDHAGTIDAPQTDINLLQRQQPRPEAQLGDETVSSYLPPHSQRSSINEEELPAPAVQYGSPQEEAFRVYYPDEESSAPANDQRAKIMQGRYYIVSPDNRLQKVLYRTVPDAEDAAGDGFTAQLKYSTVGQLQDPVYKYNSRNQLERVLK